MATNAEIKAAIKLLKAEGFTVEAPEKPAEKRPEMIEGYKLGRVQPESFKPNELHTAFRMSGFTAEAIKYPLSERAYLWLCKFNGAKPGETPWTWRYAPNPLMQASLDRDAEKDGL